MKSINLSEKREPLLADYCQFLLAGLQNFTQTYFADHTEKWSHDQLNRLLNTERIPARELWRSVRNDIDFDEDGYLLFDEPSSQSDTQKRSNRFAANGAVQKNG